MSYEGPDHYPEMRRYIDTEPLLKLLKLEEPETVL